jgi:DNA-binding winged helix-turn-helix (wHTH) protein/tetratricopeptide (TPR) repeat protein
MESRDYTGVQSSAVAAGQYRFGPFVVDRARYRVLRGAEVLELTPKLLDLLIHLVDHAGSLVTKEQLLDALWPGANVTDNALAQAVSELREALGDAAGTPQFIKTVTRRGYRFIAPVETIKVVPEEALSPAATVTSPIESNTSSIAVMDFLNVTGDADAAWLSAGIAETVTGDLMAIGRFKVADRARVLDAMRRTNGSLQDMALALGITFAVVGSYQRYGDRVRITARIVNVASGEAIADAKVDGALADIFQLQDQVVAQFSQELGITVLRPSSVRRETPSLDAYRAFTEAWLHLETLDLREIPKAIAQFEKAIEIDARYALAWTGLASAELAAYEVTRSDNAPAADLLNRAIDHARRAIGLDDTLAEAHATLALLLVSAWQTDDAVQAARRAVALEPSNWRHFFRLGHASWGDERLRAAHNTLTLYPDFAFAHFQMAMVHVARGHLREAETVLRQGAAVQDRQMARGDRYPGLGLHWLLGLVRLTQGDHDEALAEFDREMTLANLNRLYGREYKMSALHARGVCLLGSGRAAEAITAFENALELYPDHAQTHLALSLAFRTAGSSGRADLARTKLTEVLGTLAESRPIEAKLVESQWLTADGQFDRAAATLRALLETAPPGFAAWTLPVDPVFRQLHGTQGFTVALQTLAERAR